MFQGSSSESMFPNGPQVRVSCMRFSRGSTWDLDCFPFYRAREGGWTPVEALKHPGERWQNIKLFLGSLVLTTYKVGYLTTC